MVSIFTYLIIWELTDQICYGIKEPCTAYYFYDSVTKSCAPCSDICDHANIQGTVEQCTQECQMYKLSLTNTVTPTTPLPPAISPETVSIELIVVCAFLGCIAIVIICLLFCKFCRSDNQHAHDEQDVERSTNCWKVNKFFLKKRQTNHQNSPEETSLTDQTSSEGHEDSVAIQETHRQPCDHDFSPTRLPSAARSGQTFEQ